MPDKEPQFTVTDRRKFTSEGELRDENANAGSAEESASEPPAASSAAARPGTAEARQSSAPGQDQGQPSAQQPAGQSGPTAPAESAGPTAEETSRQTRDYDAITGQLDAFARQAGAGPQPMDFSRLVQSIYMTALYQMGAAGEPNEQPQIDLIGARESIDMLGVLEEKSKGNLTDEEKRLLESALFGLRMSFVEITNAINASAQKQSRQGKRP